MAEQFLGRVQSLGEGAEETRKVFCNWCKSETNHCLRARYTWYRNTDDQTSIDLEDVLNHLEHICKHENSIWMCAGCDTVTFEWRLMYPSFDTAAQKLCVGEWEAHDGAFLSTRSRAKLFKNLGPTLDGLYRDVVASFAEGRLLLCTVGLRTLIEGVCADKGLTDSYSKDLRDKIDGLTKLLANPNIIEALHAVRLAGRDATHRLEALSQEEAQLAIDIVEDLLNFLYDLDYRATQMKNASRRATIAPAKPDSVH
jgi:hypothetical protein